MSLIKQDPALLAVTEVKTSLTLTGQEPLVDKLAELDSIKTIATAEIEKGRQILDAEAMNLRIKAEKTGSFARKVNAVGHKVVLPYEFKNAFTNLDKLTLTTLNVSLGEGLVKRLFTTKKKITLKKGKSLEDVVALLGDSASEFFDIDEKVVVPVDKFMEQRFLLRGQLDDISNDKVDEVVLSISQKPALSFK